MVRMEFDRQALEAWQRDQPLSVLQLDPADRAVLRIAGRRYNMHYLLPYFFELENYSLN